jgi:hypothetical protein
VKEIADTRTAGIRKPRTSSREEASKLIMFLLELQVFMQ